MGLLPLEPLEVHTGMLLGSRRTALPEDDRTLGEKVGPVLDALLVRALAHQPCHVSFSGGRDSSVILAAATRVARREGLPDPVPLTARYPAFPATYEDEWQEAVVRHIGLRDWTIFHVGEELDALGDLATSLLRRHGLYAPTPAHSMAFFARQAGGGALLTGTGGDEILSPEGFRRRRFRDIARIRPRRRAVRAAVFNALPASVRSRIETRRRPIPSPTWLRPEGRQLLIEAWRDSSWHEATWRDALVGMLDSRGYEVTRAVLDTFAREEGVVLIEPFYDPRFVRAFARSSPRMGFATREEALESLFRELLPRRVLHRSTKAVFNEVLAGPRVREFARSWDGQGIDDRLADPRALRAAWSQRSPDVRSLPSLQQAWLAAQ